MPETYFISGHIDITDKEFQSHYVPAIQAAISEDAKFVIGDAFGTDLMAAEYLKDSGIDPLRVTIFHIKSKCHNNAVQSGRFIDKGGFRNHEEKDSSMTSSSDFDIAYVRSIDEQKRLYGSKYRHRVSGTEKNLLRRKSNNIK